VADQVNPATFPTIDVAGVVFHVHPFKPSLYSTERGNGNQVVTVAEDYTGWWTSSVMELGSIVFVSERYVSALEAVEALSEIGYLP
jgi:hypothetical protein